MIRRRAAAILFCGILQATHIRGFIQHDRPTHIDVVTSNNDSTQCRRNVHELRLQRNSDEQSSSRTALHYRRDENPKMLPTPPIIDLAKQRQLQKERRGRDKEVISKNDEIIEFACDLEFACDPLPHGTDRLEDMVAFLRGDECHRLLLSAGGTRETTTLESSPQLDRMWNEARLKFPESIQSSVPTSCQDYVSTDAIIKFPGLTLTNTVVNGIAELNPVNDGSEPGQDASSPKFVYLLVGEKRRVKGAKPIVWLFNKMTGDDKASKTKKSQGDKGMTDFSSPKGLVATFSSIVLQSDERSIISSSGSSSSRRQRKFPVFHVDIQFQIKMVFPKSLLKWLPTSKDKVEQQGSATCAKTVSKDVEIAIQRVRQAYLNEKQPARTLQEFLH